MAKKIWIFSDENGKLLGFKSFKEAHRYTFEVYDKDLKFNEKIMGVYYYKNSWNDEDVSICSLEMFIEEAKD